MVGVLFCYFVVLLGCFLLFRCSGGLGCWCVCGVMSLGGGVGVCRVLCYVVMCFLGYCCGEYCLKGFVVV